MQPGHGRDLLGAALLDRNFGDAVGDGEVDRRRRQRHVKWHVVVVRRERLEIGPDLVADVAVGGDAVGADDDEIDQPVLHQVAAGIVGDHRVRHAVLAELPGGERSALIARPGLVGKDVNGNALIVRQIDRRRRGADIDRREPAGIAMGEHVHRLAALLARRDGFDQRQAVAADRRD